MITYQEFGVEKIEEVMNIFENDGWDLYLLDRAKTCRAFERSLFCLGAFDEGRLVGFVRCSGDGEYTVNIEDCIVEADYRRRHIGHALLDAIAKKYDHVDMITLLTDLNDEAVNRFYQTAGFQTYESKALIGYARQIRQ